MSKTVSAIGANLWTAKPKFKRRSKAPHRRGSKSLGPKSGMRGDRGKH